MKKYLLILTTFISLAVAHGQTNVYQPFPTDSASWFYEYVNGGTPHSTSYSFGEWLGDTTINSILYKKTYVQQWNSAGLHYTGGIRQDIANEKIYEIFPNGVELDVSLSQHLIIGDTLHVLLCNGAMIITSIDSVKVGTKFHKRYNAKCTDSIAKGSYIVGVGEENWSSSEYAETLLCFSVGNINQYGLAPYCKLVSINELSINKNQISIFPNPPSPPLQLCR